VKKLILGLLISLTLAGTTQVWGYQSAYIKQAQDDKFKRKLQEEIAEKNEARRLEIEHATRPQNFASHYADSWTATEWAVQILCLGLYEAGYEYNKDQAQSRRDLEYCKMLNEIRYNKYKESKKCHDNAGYLECYE
jgi:hypothetical protein